MVPMQENSAFYRVWLITDDGQILISSPKKKILNETDITIETNTFNELFKHIEEKFGIFVDTFNLEFIYEEEYPNKVKTYNYILSLNFTKSQKKVIENHFNGQFFGIHAFYNLVYDHSDGTYSFHNVKLNKLFAILFEKFAIQRNY